MAQRPKEGVRGGADIRDDADGHGHEGVGRRRGDGDDEASSDNPARQAAVIAQRWVGSAPPTQALYARARQQWLKLPGAVSRSAADVQMPGASAPARPLLAAPDQDDGGHLP